MARTEQRQSLRQETSGKIKDTARRLMREKGTAGLSLRGIARQMGVTAPALYNYFPRLDDLITALVVDAFGGLADAMQRAADESAGEACARQILRVSLAYRDWALEHPVDFQLIYGNPIPGYEAPAAVTTPLARRPFEILALPMVRAFQQGELVVPRAYRQLPAEVEAALQAFEAQSGLDLPLPLLNLLVSGWTRLHGLVMLELFGHIQPVVGSSGSFCEQELLHFLSGMGLSLVHRLEDGSY